MRLIDADVIIDDLTAMQSEFDVIDIDGMIRGIENAPTIDVENLRPYTGMRIEINTSCFQNDEIAKERGYYRKYFFCPSCNAEIGHQTLDRRRVFGQGTILHSNEFPDYCPKCGAKMKGESDDAI